MTLSLSFFFFVCSRFLSFFSFIVLRVCIAFFLVLKSVNSVSRKFKECLKLKGCFEDVSRKFQGYLQRVSSDFQRNFMGVSGKFHECFKDSSGKFSLFFKKLLRVLQ